MKKIVRVTESQLTSLIKKVIKEGTQEAQMAEINSEFNSLNLPTLSMDDFNQDSIPDEILNAAISDDPKPKEGIDEKISTLDKIHSVICTANENQLREAKEQIKQILRQKRKSIGQSLKNILKGKKEQTNEQAEGLMAGAASILGVTAPLWVWIAIGAIVIFLICKFILFPKRDGYGCRGRSRYITGYRSKLGFGY